MEHDDPRRDDLRNCSTCQHGLVCRHRRGVEDALEGCPLAVAFGGADHVIDALAQGCGAYLPDEHAREDRSADVRGYVEGLIVPDLNRFAVDHTPGPEAPRSRTIDPDAGLGHDDESGVY